MRPRKIRVRPPIVSGLDGRLCLCRREHNKYRSTASPHPEVFECRRRQQRNRSRQASPVPRLPTAQIRDHIWPSNGPASPKSCFLGGRYLQSTRPAACDSCNFRLSLILRWWEGKFEKCCCHEWLVVIVAVAAQDSGFALNT